MKLLKIINPENATDEEVATYSVREASRAVVVDQEGKIGLLHVVNNNHYKIPGGGIDEGEDRVAALKRECIEEIGCEVEVLRELGMIVEYRKIFELKQTSYCYLAQVIGEKGIPHLEADELEDGFQIEWMSYNEAILAFERNTASTFEGREYMVPRDSEFLQSAKDYLLEEHLIENVL